LAGFRDLEKTPKKLPQFLTHLGQRSPEEWAPRAAGPTLHLQQSFQQVNVQQLSDSALAEYQQMIRVVYADPPWTYRDHGVVTANDAYGRAERHYPAMSTDDLCENPDTVVQRHSSPLILEPTLALV
jgi:hypothetical protein